MSRPLDHIVYWIGDKAHAEWVTRREAQVIIARPDTHVTQWLRA